MSENSLSSIVFPGHEVKHRKEIICEWSALISKGVLPGWTLSSDIDSKFSLTDRICQCGKRYFIQEKKWSGYCSPECASIAKQFFLYEIWGAAETLEILLTGCPACGRHPKVKPHKSRKGLYGFPLEEEVFDLHHINYETEKTVFVCKRCHGKITRRQKGLECFFSVNSPRKKCRGQGFFRVSIWTYREDFRESAEMRSLWSHRHEFWPRSGEMLPNLSCAIAASRRI